MSHDPNDDTGSLLSQEAVLDYGWRMFDHLTDQIQNADTKASLILGVDAFLLGTLAALIAERFKSLPGYHYMLVEVLSASLLGLALLTLGTSVYFALLATRPSMKRATDGGLFYFSMIRAIPSESFIERFEMMTPHQVRHDLLAQVHTLAGITQRKFQRNAISLNLLLASLLLWSLAEILTIFG